jgi:prevent-host-death family protein
LPRRRRLGELGLLTDQSLINWYADHEELTSVEAKTNFGSVLDAVEGGEEVLVTRNGKQVARIVPVDAPAMTRAEAMEQLVRFASGRTLGKLDWRAMRNEGRK